MMQTLEYPTGKMIEFHKPTPDEFGLKEWRDPIGELAMPPNTTLDQFTEAEKRLYELLDDLLPAFQTWTIKTDSDRENIKKFSELFALISEPPLKPYYDMIGYDFFHWLKK